MLKLNKARFYIGILPLICLMLSQCARIGHPIGGDKDVIPPKVIQSNPTQGATNFKGKSIDIFFDEFVQLKNITQELLVSPPLEKKPVVILKGKSITIDLKRVELADSTTYTISFGESLTDLNELNPLPGFEFVFSTGSYIDSFSARGILVNSFNLKVPEKPTMVMLYTNTVDSVPYQQKPAFIGRTNKSGYFSINHVRPGVYKIFALQDANNNLLFDQPTEAIAFEDTLVFLTPAFFEEFGTYQPEPLLSPDSVSRSKLALGIKSTQDSIKFVRLDSMRLDSIARIPKYSIFTKLFLFTEKSRIQYLTNYSRSDPRMIQFTFNQPVTDTLGIELLMQTNNDWYYRENTAKTDTINLWITDSTVFKKDTLQVNLAYYMKDSLNNTYLYNDTLRLLYKSISAAKRTKADTKVKKVDNFTLGIRDNGLMDLNSAIAISGKYPINKVNFDSINLSLMVDSIAYPQKLNYSYQKLTKRIVNLSPTWKEESTYHFFATPGAFTDMYGRSNDTIDIKFKTKGEDSYGNIKLTLTGVQDSAQVIVQLFDKDRIAAQKSISGNGVMTFNYLSPKIYSFKFIFDKNHNEEWDTGYYLKHQQPEKVLLKKETFQVRANWDLEVAVDLQELDKH